MRNAAIQRYIKEPAYHEIFGEAVSAIWSTRSWPMPGALAFVAIMAAVTAVAGSLKTIRISFKDIRDVDVLLDYFIRDLGFQAPQKRGDMLVFRATWWTIFAYNIFQLQARVSGNTVVLTGPTPMMRRLKRRILSFAKSPLSVPDQG